MSENVSEELGARLLAPTPGARMLLSTVCKEEKEKEEKKNPVVKKSAKDLIQEHKQSLQFNSPKLGRGLSKTGEFSLDISPSMKKNYMNKKNWEFAVLTSLYGNAVYIKMIIFSISFSQDSRLRDFPGYPRNGKFYFPGIPGNRFPGKTPIRRVPTSHK